MPCADGTSVLMKFDDIVNAVSYIFELADTLSANLFHWTFCHAVPNAQCKCGINVPQMGVLLEEDIMKLLLHYCGVCHHARPVVFQQPGYPTVYQWEPTQLTMNPKELK